MDDLTLRDILAILIRRRNYFIVTAGILFAISLLFVMKWSNYRSTATVQIEQSYIAANVSNPNEIIVTLADQRINQIQQKITALESLAQIIKKFNLYPESIDRTPMNALTAKMRAAIKLNFISGSLSNPAAAQKQTAEQLSAIAFNLSFDYKDPEITQRVTDELVTRFLDEDLKMRRMQAQETSDFLGTQITALEESIAEQEKNIAEFRAKNGESGPSALMFNQQAAASTNMSIHNLETQITTNEGTQGALRTQLALVDPYSRVIADGQLLTTPGTQLKALETEYTTLTSKYGTSHPDVIKARRQIAALKSQLGSTKDSVQIQAKIDDVRTNLAAAESTNGADHPDVIALKAKLEKLEKALEASPPPSKKDFIKADADNPAYIQLAAQLKTAEAQHEALVKERDRLVEQQAKYEKTIALNPGVEREMSKLTRDYDNSQMRYRELKEKKMIADMSEQLELGRKGQRLIVINPPGIPDNTYPKRALLMLGGLIFAVMGGLTSVVVAEALSQSVHGTSHLARLMGTPPLVIIPHIMSDEEIQASKWTSKLSKLRSRFAQRKGVTGHG